MERAPRCCREDQAMEYMAMEANMFHTLRREGYIKTIRRGVYAYDDLDRAIDRLQHERDGLKLEVNEEEERETTRQPIRSKAVRSHSGSAQELLLPIVQRGRKKAGK